MSVDFDYKKAEIFFAVAENRGSKEARNFLCEVLNFVKNNIPEDKWRWHSLFQKQPGATIHTEDWFDSESEILFYNEADELIASFTVPNPNHSKIMEDGRSRFNFKLYAKNCDNRLLWDKSNANNAYFIDRLGYYKPTEWDRNNNHFISLDKINAMNHSEVHEVGKVFGENVHSYPDNLPYVECDYYLNLDEIKQLINQICTETFKRPSNFLIEIWPSFLIKRIVDQLESSLDNLYMDDQVYSLMAKFLFYSAIINARGYSDTVIDCWQDYPYEIDSSAPIFKAKFNDPFPNFYKNKEYEVSRFWQLQTLIMKKDALKKLLFKDIKEFCLFQAELYKQDEDSVKELFSKKFLSEFLRMKFYSDFPIG